VSRQLRPPMHTWLRWLCLSLCYLAFAGSLSAAEGVAAALAGAFATALSLGLRARGERRLSLRGRWTAVLARMALQLVRDIGRVGVTLLGAIIHGHRGRMVRDRESADRPLGTGTGHTAITALLASLTPDSIALEPSDHAIPVHRLSRASNKADDRRRAP
jgi:hypothetical protein